MRIAFCASALSLTTRPSLRRTRLSTLLSPANNSFLQFRNNTHLTNSTPAYFRPSRALACATPPAGPTLHSPSASTLTTINAPRSENDPVELLRQRFSLLDNNDLSAQQSLILSAFPFSLDRFQTSALSALSRGESVVLSAPTGSGKTVVGEMAVYLALCRQLRVFYTTPLKALSNQKFYDFKKLFGDNRVGLLTGDVTINRNADIVVMTTEVYRNMLYAESTETPTDKPVTDDLFAVVFDEFHYLNDRDRGTVWEESVINSPEHVLLVALSATMSNALDVKDWFASVQGPTTLIQSDIRPVPLTFAYCDNLGMTPLFAEDTKKARQRRGFGRRRKKVGGESRSEVKLHPKLLRRLKEAKEERNRDSRRSQRGRVEEEDPRGIMKGKYRDIATRANRRSKDRYAEIPSFPFVTRNLFRRDLLPCIVFIFSRAGCDRAAGSLSSERTSLVTEKERERIRERLDAFVAEHPGMVQPDRLNLALQGIASHHAGLLPLWKLCVEELFQDGLIKVVFATETLAAGINMPARTTVISALSKRAGEQGIVSLTPSEVAQLAGRAGRRGKDLMGHSVVLRSRNEGALEAFKVVTADVDALESKFTPNYGMVLNLLSARPLDDAKKLVDRSFGNFLRGKQAQEALRTTADDKTQTGNAETLLREKEALQSVLEDAKALVSSIDEKELRAYVKSLERLKAEKRALSFLVQQSTTMDAELIEETLTFAPTGTRLLLKEKRPGLSTGAQRRRSRRDYSAALAAAADGDLGVELKSFYLGATDSELEDIDNEADEERESVTEAILLDMHNESVGVLPMFAAVDANGVLRLFNHNAVSQLFYDEDAIDVEALSPSWADMRLPGRSEWQQISGEQYSAPLPDGLEQVVEMVKEWQLERQQRREQEPNTPTRELEQQHPEVFAQRERVRYAKERIKEQELHKNEDIAMILAAKRAIPKLEATLDGNMDPFGTKRRKGKREGLSMRYAGLGGGTRDGLEEDLERGIAQNSIWEEFMSIVSVLQHYGFVDDNYDVTSLGSIGAKVRSENELWTSLVLLQPALEYVSPMHLGAIVGAAQMEPSRPDVYIEYEVSSATKDAVAEAAAERARLFAVQSEYNVFTPIYLDADLMGLVETWASGVSWVELLSGTSLQEGDACRILRRVLDLLRQVQYLPIVSEGLKRNAKRAVALLDRFPVTDDRTYVVRENERIVGSNGKGELEFE